MIRETHLGLNALRQVEVGPVAWAVVSEIGRFRVLVIGRSNADKTTLLQRVCNTTELPEIYNSKGKKMHLPCQVKGKKCEASKGHCHYDA